MSTYIAQNARNSRELITPEGIDLNVKLATRGSRAGAFCIDLLIMIIVLIAFTWGLFSLIDADSSEMGMVIWTLFFFFVRSFYFMFFEMSRRAATPGKMMLKIRVAARGKARLTANAVFARNALREIEVFLPLSFLLSNAGSVDGWISLIGLIWSGIFLFFPCFNKDKLRAGDLIAGTWVVEAPRTALLTDLSTARTASSKYIFSSTQINAYGVHELHVLEDVIRRNNFDTVREVSERIRTKIEWAEGAGDNDNEFLKAYYGALRGRLENKMLFGVRRKDKHDTR